MKTRIALFLMTVGVPVTSAALGAETGTPPPPISSTDRFNPVPLLSYQELYLSLGVLLFGMVVVFIEYRLLSQIKSSADEVLRALAVSLIIVVCLVLVSAGYGEKQFSPVLGLFGTIIGYLLGSSGRKGS